MIVKKHPEKDRKLFASFIDLEKADDRIERKGLWDILNIYCLGGDLLVGIRSFYKDLSASVHMNEKLFEC